MGSHLLYSSRLQHSWVISCVPRLSTSLSRSCISILATQEDGASWMGVALEWQMTSGHKGWCHICPIQGSVGPAIWKHPACAWALTAFGRQGNPPVPEPAPVTFCWGYSARVFFFSSLKLPLQESADLENNVLPPLCKHFFLPLKVVTISPSAFSPLD